MNKQAGLSLIELMVAVIISSLLILGVTQIFSSTSQSDQLNSAVARAQESGRVALEIIGEDARRAGYQGCSSAAVTSTIGAYEFPDQAIAGVSKSVTFRYATTENTGTTIAGKKTCDGGTLYLKTVTYDQCANGTSLCMNGTAILDNATVTAISFGVFDADTKTTKWVDSAGITSAQLASTQSVRVSLTINDTRNNLSRVFTNTYELRNRIL